MRQIIERTKADIATLGGLSAKTEEAERQILSRAKTRLDEVDAQISRLQPGMSSADDSESDLYTDLISERAQLLLIITRSEKSLA